MQRALVFNFVIHDKIKRTEMHFNYCLCELTKILFMYHLYKTVS